MDTEKQMTRCECHEVDFRSVLGFARRTGVRRLEGLCRLLNLGQTCTACHCDLRDMIEHNLGPFDAPEETPSESGLEESNVFAEPSNR